MRVDAYFCKALPQCAMSDHPHTWPQRHRSGKIPRCRSTPLSDRLNKNLWDSFKQRQTETVKSSKQSEGRNFVQRAHFTVTNPFLRPGGGPHVFGGAMERPKHWGAIILSENNPQRRKKWIPHILPLIKDTQMTRVHENLDPWKIPMVVLLSVLNLWG